MICVKLSVISTSNKDIINIYHLLDHVSKYQSFL